MGTWALIHAAWLLATPALARPPCEDRLLPKVAYPASGDETTYDIEVEYGKGVYFHLQDAGVLTVQLRGIAARTSPIDPAQELPAAVDHFGARVHSIQVDWWNDSADMEEFQAARARGLNAKRAALLTPMGRAAQALGFGEVEIPGDTAIQLKLFGRAAPNHVTFRFNRPD
jgi:hypothetical protein